MAAAMGSESKVTLTQWVLDTRPLWPLAKKTADLAEAASSALALLPKADQANVLRYYHVADAKLALGSALLKRLAISRLCSVAWSAASPVRDARTKPVYLDARGGQPLVFNVSHQAGLVVLLALRGENLGGSDDATAGDGGGGGSGSAAVGVDIVCPTERRARDHDSIAKQGWTHFVDMHADVFSPKDTAALRALASSGDGDGGVDGRDSALRHFYALWCLREAYVKMTGDALLAEWLAQLEMPGFAPPEAAAAGERNGAGVTATAPWQQEVWVGGRRVEDVNLVLRPLLGGEYMVATAIRVPSGGGEHVELGEFESVDMDDVVAYGEAAVAAEQ